MRSAIICVFSLIPLASMASYELALFESYGKIQRYDPVNRVMLGSFGDGDIGTYAGFSMALSATRPGEVAVLNPDGAIRWLDYNTGISTINVNLGWFHNSYSGKLSVQDDGNYVASVAETETRIYSAGGSLVSTLSPFGSAYKSLSHTTDSAGNIYDLTRYDNGGSYSFYSFAFTAAGAYLGYTSLGTSSDRNYLRYATSTADRLIFGTASSSLGPMVVTAPLSWGGSGTQVFGTGYVTGGWSNLAPGHSGRAHGLQSFYNSSTGFYDTWYYTYDPVVGSWGYRHKLPGTDPHNNSFVMVVAPEPASALALAAGAFWILRRKK